MRREILVGRRTWTGEPATVNGGSISKIFGLTNDWSDHKRSRGLSKQIDANGVEERWGKAPGVRVFGCADARVSLECPSATWT